MNASDLLPTVDELHRLRLVANGTLPGDVAIRNGMVLSVHTGELLERDVIIAGRHIAAVVPRGRLSAASDLDAAGLFVIPTFIDTHVHIEYTMLTPGELARLIVPKGTTTLLADPNCIGNVLGGPGMDLVADTDTPMRILQQVSSKIPRTPELELGGAVVTAQEIVERVRRDNAVTLGESNPFDLSEESTAKQQATIAAGKRITGHTARLGDEPLWGYLAGGVGDDHNAVTTEEVLERLRLGAMVTVMSGSMNDNCPTVFADIPALGTGMAHLSFCTDDKHVEDLFDQGAIDHHVRSAVASGVPPEWAIRMGTLNAAVHYRLDHALGSITPSRLADLQLVADLADPRPSMVMVGGVVVARDAEPLFENHDSFPDWASGTMHLSPTLSAASFAVPATGETAWVQAVEMYDGYFKRAFHVELPVVNGSVVPDPSIDVLKVAVVDRHHGTDAVGIGFVRGFALSRGALAASTNCENQNLVLVGASDADLALAARTAQDIGGGYVVVADGSVVATCALPLAGIMADAPWEDVRAQSIAVNAAAAGLGCPIHGPFMIMAFIGLAGVPDMGLTERGLVETASQTFIDVVLGTEMGMVCCRCPSHLHQLSGPAS